MNKRTVRMDWRTLWFIAGCCFMLSACTTVKKSGSSQSLDLHRTGTSILVITFHGLPAHASAGTICVALWGGKDTFMKDGMWMRSALIPAINADKPCIIQHLPTGEFSVSAFYDITNCGKLRRNGFGIPIDPWGISNGETHFQPPDWDRSAFDIGEGTTSIEIEFNQVSEVSP